MSEIHPNWFAYLALLIWPIVGLYLYSRLPVARATLWTILGGFLLLPTFTEIKIEHVPQFDKISIPNLVALVGCAVFARRASKFRRRFGLAEFFVFILIIGPFITSELNTDPIVIGGTVLPGVGSYDALSAAVRAAIFVLPFFLGRRFLSSADDNLEILRIMVIAGLAYSIPILLEIRVSPQLSNWLYGYAPTKIITEFRFGGFRPVVFLTNGLWVGFFMATTAIASAALWRTQIRLGRLPPGGISGYLFTVLVLCKTAGSIVYASILVPLVRWTSPRCQLRVACILAMIALTYPLLRLEDLVPTNSILSVASAVNTERAASLRTRFVQEEALLQRAWKRPWFGWGRYGRSRVYDASGRDISLTDGQWVLILGTFGIFGFLGEFGLLTLVVFRAAKANIFASTGQESRYLAALALIVAINMIDLLPNSSISPWTWLLAGALVGRAEALREANKQQMRVHKRFLPIGGLAPTVSDRWSPPNK